MENFNTKVMCFSKDCENEKLFLKGQLDMLKQVYESTQKRNCGSERELRRRLVEGNDKCKRELETVELLVSQLREELRIANEHLERTVNDKENLKKLFEENAALVKQKETCLDVIRESEEELSEVKQLMNTLEQNMQEERNKQNAAISELEDKFNHERRARNFVENQNNHLKADLQYIKTMLKQDDIIVLKTPHPCRRENSGRQLATPVCGKTELGSVSDISWDYRNVNNKRSGADSKKRKSSRKEHFNKHTVHEKGENDVKSVLSAQKTGDQFDYIEEDEIIFKPPWQL